MTAILVIVTMIGLGLLWLRVHRLENRLARRRNRSSREW